MLQHQDLVARCQCHCTARSTLANYDRYQWRFQRQALFDGPRQSFCLSTLFTPTAGKRPSGVYQGNDGEVETLCQFKQTIGLAVSFRPREAEIVLQAFIGGAPFFVPHNHASHATKPRKPTHQGVIIHVFAVACELNKIIKQGVDIVQKMGAVRMTRNLRFLPGIQVGVDLLELLVGLVAQSAQLIIDGCAPLIGSSFQRRDLAFHL